MPRPTYIICSQSHSLDQHTGLMSVFHIIEGFEIIRKQIQTANLTTEDFSAADLQIVVNATWSKLSNEDEKQEYIHEIIMKSPGEDDNIISTDSFVFTKQYQRFTVVIRKTKPWKQSGDCIFESRIRPRGHEPWISQEYVFPVIVRDQEDNE